MKTTDLSTIELFYTTQMLTELVGEANNYIKDVNVAVEQKVITEDTALSITSDLMKDMNAKTELIAKFQKEIDIRITKSTGQNKNFRFYQTQFDKIFRELDTAYKNKAKELKAQGVVPLNK